MPERNRSYSSGSARLARMERRESRDATTARATEPREPNELSRDELEEELTIAAYAPGRLRLARYERLLAERQRRLIAA